MGEVVTLLYEPARDVARPPRIVQSMKKLGLMGAILGALVLAGCGHHGRSACNASQQPPPQVVIVQVPAGSVVNPPATVQQTPPPAPAK